MTVGIVGTGRIGREFAERVHALKCSILAYDPQYAASGAEKLPYITYVDTMDELLAQSDIVSLHCPLTAEIKCMINERTLSLMKPTAILINTARGGLVDEQALADALNSGRIAGAGIDVLTNEPMREGCPLYRAKNCLITPHIAWAPLETRIRLLGVVEDNLRAWISGEPANNVAR
jgi:phosphoglycerate dehydrogenase-like enzyme